MTSASSSRRLIALDVDGTVLREDGSLGEAVAEQIVRVQSLGHEVMLATGRSPSMTVPVADRLGIHPEYLVCANGAILLRRDPLAAGGYRREFVETFDPTPVLTTIRSHLSSASYAVEDPDGVFHFTGAFPEGALGVLTRESTFDELLRSSATRVVVLSPSYATEDFLAMVERMGLHQVTYNVGWTAWLDIAPEGVNKATGMERVRELLGIPRANVVAMGDGRNDIDLLQWASALGTGIAMGQAPDEVHAVANRSTGTDLEDGVAQALAELFPVAEYAAS